MAIYSALLESNSHYTLLTLSPAAPQVCGGWICVF